MVFDRVGFAYEESRPVLQGVSLTCPERSLTALVGPSGSGKTTLTRLVARFWDVSEGSVSIGGVDVRDMRPDELMQQISLVFQDVYLFDGTIEENVLAGRPDATPEEVRRAAHVARLDEVAARLEQGWDTPVGEGGCRLSGERQRVAIARALLTRPSCCSRQPRPRSMRKTKRPSWRLDELARSHGHRYSPSLTTIAAADQIAVLEKGCITQQGTHGDLVKVPGRYRSFWRERQQAAGWRLASEQ
ncbi:MAG: ABC transporter ATP-binding protein [Eggerthella lenta]